MQTKIVLKFIAAASLTVAALKFSSFSPANFDATATKIVAAQVSQIEGSTEAWRFGILSDTQWGVGNPDPVNCPLGDTANCDGKNPNGVAAGIIREINKQFIIHGVKFVIETGDLADAGDARGLDTIATFMQELYDHGIGFYPLRGNHEGSEVTAGEFQRIFPQTQTGINNQTPGNALVSTLFYGAPRPNSTQPFAVGSNFVSPAGLAGLIYSFDYENARFVLLDQFASANGLHNSTLNKLDMDWLEAQLASRPANTHAFVFGHKHLISENHTDTLFGNNPSENLELQDRFIASLYDNGVRYYIGGHDHMHNRAIVKSPNGASSVQDITTPSTGYKFYVPQNPSNDYLYDVLVPPITGTPLGKARETPIAQELFTIGYYIVTVDGPKVTVDYYSSPNGCNGDCALTRMPESLVFSKRETFGYSCNGKEFLVPEGGSYSVVQDSFGNTRASILSGINTDSATTYDHRALTKTVDTGWTLMSASNNYLISNILTLWGMAKIPWEEASVADGLRRVQANNLLVDGRTDDYVLSMTWDNTGFFRGRLHLDELSIATLDKKGDWVNAVDMNFGGIKRFVAGPWQSTYELGTYGVDLKTHTAWAVINHNGDFAVKLKYHFPLQDINR